MKKLFLSLIILFAMSSAFSVPGKDADFYQLKIYHLKTNEQISKVDKYLKDVYLPALHRNGVKAAGVFKPVANDTATDKTVYVFIPYSSLDQWSHISEKLVKDAGFMTEGQSFTNASADNVPYERMETILLEAFPGQAHLVIPLKKEGRIFELRSYESPTENLHVKKMDMFNTGGEIPLFNRLGFNPIFYGKVIAGGKMPNFMYMPIFDNLEQRTEQWKTFGNDPVWKDISTRPENENKVSVSHIDSIVMQAAEYSDI